MGLVAHFENFWSKVGNIPTESLQHLNEGLQKATSDTYATGLLCLLAAPANYSGVPLVTGRRRYWPQQPLRELATGLRCWP